MQRRVFTFLALLALGLVPRAALAQCQRLTPAMTARLSRFLRTSAPPWTRPLVTPQAIRTLDEGSFHALHYFPGFATIRVERLGTRETGPWSAVLLFRCTGAQVEAMTDELAWANQHAPALHLALANGEDAANYAAEVLSLGPRMRPTSAQAQGRRGEGHWRVTVLFAPSSPGTPGSSRDYEVTRDGSIRPAS